MMYFSRIGCGSLFIIWSPYYNNTIWLLQTGPYQATNSILNQDYASGPKYDHYDKRLESNLKYKNTFMCILYAIFKAISLSIPVIKYQIIYSSADKMYLEWLGILRVFCFYLSMGECCIKNHLATVFNTFVLIYRYQAYRVMVFTSDHITFLGNYWTNVLPLLFIALLSIKSESVLSLIIWCQIYYEVVYFLFIIEKTYTFQNITAGKFMWIFRCNNPIFITCSLACILKFMNSFNKTYKLVEYTSDNNKKHVTL